MKNRNISTKNARKSRAESHHKLTYMLLIVNYPPVYRHTLSSFNPNLPISPFGFTCCVRRCLFAPRDTGKCCTRLLEVHRGLRSKGLNLFNKVFLPFFLSTFRAYWASTGNLRISSEAKL